MLSKPDIKIKFNVCDIAKISKMPTLKSTSMGPASLTSKKENGGC